MKVHGGVIVTLIGLFLLVTTCAQAVSQEAVNFPDPNLEQAIREAINKPTGDIYDTDLVGLTYLNASNRSIVNLEGIQHCTNLTDLDLSSNQISDISALSGLTNLTDLDLSSNQISDISALSSLTELTRLYLGSNQISDLSALTGLTNLTGLGLGGNQIRDISVLSGLTNLTELYLDDNQISDLSALTGLTNLTDLDLGNNQISDLNVLSVLTNLQYLSLNSNQISDISALSGLTNLTWLALGGNHISNINVLAGLRNLTYLFLWGNQINDISALAGLTKLTGLNLYNNQIKDIHPLVNNSGLSAEDKLDVRDNYLDLSSGSDDMQDIQALIDRGVDVLYKPQKDNYVTWLWFSYELTSVNPAADTFALTFVAHAYPDTVEINDWHWYFGDGTEDHGETVTHTFSGLGKVSVVVLEVSTGSATYAYTEVVWGLSGLSRDLAEALQTGDASELQQLQGSLSWSGGSVEKIYRACVDACLEVFDLADRYGLTSLNQVSQALTKALGIPVSQRKLHGVSRLVGLDIVTAPLGEMVKPLWSLLQQLPGWKQLFNTTTPKSDASAQRQMVGSITLPQIYQEAEDIATFVNDELAHLSPVVSDTTFALQVPTCVGCDPELYISLDNGDIVGILAGIAVSKASLEILLAYTPGDLFMNNLAFQFFDDGSIEAQGWDTITNTLWDNFNAARGNGILDLNGSGDGDAAAGFEVFPAAFLTLRDGQWLESAKENLAQALAWLREAIQDMPSSPGTHDPQIEWPLQITLPWTGESVSVDKADLLNWLNSEEACLQGPATVNFDINFDGVTDYSTIIDLSIFFDNPITDLKTLLPDLVVANNPDDPLIISRSFEEVEQDWKINGTLNRSTEYVSIDFPDPTFGGILPNSDANNLLALFIFGHANPACQNEESQLDAKGWHMMALPGELCSTCEPWGPGEGGDLICALSDDIDPCHIFRYDPNSSGYVMAPPAENILYHAGMGFWVRTYEDDVTVDAEVQVPSEAVEVRLGKGWNQVGNPFAFAVAANALKVRCGDTVLSLTDAQAQGWVSAYLFGYDTASGGYVMIDPTSGCLQPWSGYWMRSYRDGCVLIIPPTVYTGFSTAAQALSVKELQARGLELPPAPPALKLMSEDVVKGLTVRNIPNPIRSEHTTTFKVEGEGVDLVQAIRVEIYDLAGQKVFTQEINAKELEWHTVNDAGELLANGVYLYQVWVKLGGKWYPTGVHKLAVVR